MRTHRKFIPLIVFFIILILVLAACNLPMGTLAAQVPSGGLNSAAATVPAIETSTPITPVPTATQIATEAPSPTPSSVATLDLALLSNFLLSLNPKATPTPVSFVPLIHYIGIQPGLPLNNPSPASWNDISSWQLLWNGNPVPSTLVLYTPDCGQPLSVDSFSAVITANKSTNFSMMWVAFIITWNAAHTAVVSQTAAGQGNQMAISFNAAGTQTINQDVPFMLNCGVDYTIVTAVQFPTGVGGYPIMQDLIISLNPTATPKIKYIFLPTFTPTHAATHTPKPTLKPTLIHIIIPPILFLPTPTPTVVLK
jgi:hypothetical protein